MQGRPQLSDIRGVQEVKFRKIWGAPFDCRKNGVSYMSYIIAYTVNIFYVKLIPLFFVLLLYVIHAI